MKSAYLHLDRTNDIFYYSIPENIKKCCFSMERLLGKYFLEEKNIETAFYLVFQKFKFICQSLGVILENCLNYPAFATSHDLNAFIQNDFNSEKESFLLMFFLISMMDRYSMIYQLGSSLKLRDDIFFLFGMMQLQFRDKNHFWHFNILSKFFIKILTLKYSKEIGFGRGIITLIEFDNNLIMAKTGKEMCMSRLRKYCSSWIDSIISMLNNYLNSKYQNNIIRSQSVLSNRPPNFRTAHCQLTTVDDLGKGIAQQTQIENSINGIILIFIN
jgi:hypothetical protein